MSAFSSFEWWELWRQGRCGRLAVQEGPRLQTPRLGPATSPPPLPPPTYIFPEGVQDEGLELRKTLVDARSAPLLHDRLGGLRVGLRLSPASARPRPTRATHAPPGPTFRCSAALRGLFGVLLALAGAPASGEALGFPGVSAGMVRPRACRRRASLSGGARLLARARAARRAAIKGEARGLCEPGPAFFPTLAPANERLAPPRSPTPPPAAARGNRQSRVCSLPTNPPATKGSCGTRLRAPLSPPEPGGKIAARAAHQEAASPGCPGRGTPGLGRIVGFTCRPSGAGTSWGAELSVGGAGNLKGKFARGTESGAPEVDEPRPTRLLPPPPSRVPAWA